MRQRYYPLMHSSAAAPFSSSYKSLGWDIKIIFPPHCSIYLLGLLLPQCRAKENCDLITRCLICHTDYHTTKTFIWGLLGECVLANGIAVVVAMVVFPRYACIEVHDRVGFALRRFGDILELGISSGNHLLISLKKRTFVKCY
jgi:hypothetical protein